MVMGGVVWFLNNVFRGNEDCSEKYWVFLNYFFKVKKNIAGTRVGVRSLHRVNLTWRLKDF